MNQGYQALTDREKETLRLLVEGYDAKSMAQHLGLSVHTINERLRDARRKMAVSSSREAARLLRGIEGQAPELLGDKALGDVVIPEAVQLVRQSGRSDGEWRRTAWIVGGLAMTVSLALLALSTLSGTSALSGTGEAPTAPAATTHTAVAATPASEAAAVDAARQFLALLDRDDWSASWQATHKSFQLLNTVGWWAQSSRAVRSEVGTSSSRELAMVDFTAAPPSGYWVVTFNASYSKKGRATETLQMASESGTWKVAGIMIE